MSSISFIPFPELNTQRLSLRRLSQPDAEGIFALRSNPSVIRYTGIKQYTSIEQAKDYIRRMDADLAQGKSIVWSVRETSSGTFIGSISLWDIAEDGTHAEIGYDSLPPFWGRGYMGEAATAVIAYGFESMGLNSIVADLRTDNIKSVKLLETNGFKKGRVHTETEQGNEFEMAVYTLECTDYEQRKKRDLL